jgi:hypothetical protein
MSSPGERCDVCKRENAKDWQCLACARAGAFVVLCSGICWRRHERNGRHRKQLKVLRLLAAERGIVVTDLLLRRRPPE